MKKFVKETSKKLATGALAVLATLGSASLGVSADTDPATMPNNTDFEITDTYNGNIPVYGFQTSKVYTYSLKVSWGNMKFVFDRGVYDPQNDRLTKKITNDEWAYCEAGVVTDGSAATAGVGVGKWCGFNGINNHVNVENRGNGNIGLSVACTEGLSNDQTLPVSGQGAVDMQVAVKTADMSASTDAWTFSGTTTTANMQDGTSVSAMTMASTGTTATTTIQKAINLNGVPQTEDARNQVEFYLNITGVPQQTSGAGSSASELDTLSVSEASASENYWEKIGDINLTFTPCGDSEANS